jgi:hypothetical protein
MKHISILLVLLCFASIAVSAQTAMLSTNPVAEQVMLGSYNPTLYTPSIVLNHPDTLSRGINARVSPDSMHAYLDVLRSFHTRNTGSDTVSNSRGIGAARRWAYSKFQQFSTLEGGRLIPSYLQFNMAICGQPQHRNIFGVLPGLDTSDKSIIVIEGHIDSRCAGLCDTACLAEGMEDNGSGTALVLELARVMSHYSFKNTIVFLAIIGEEQSLAGSTAFANYAVQKGIKIKAVLNNDIVGGIICGQTSSPPSCPGLNAIDSTHMRLFSQGSFNSKHKQFARFVKLEYKEQLLPHVAVPMGIHIMSDEDRIGRGSDHIPFRQNGYTSIRFTSANEHGDANVSNTSYTDRQHTSSDILGVDRNSDGTLDSFFVDFNYNARNAVINGNAAAMAAVGPLTPAFTVTDAGGGNMIVQITQQTGYPAYRFALRSNTHDWDSVYTFSGAGPHTIQKTPANYIISAASQDALGVESLFSAEQMAALDVATTEEGRQSVELLQNKPNPFDEATTISVLIRQPVQYKEAYIQISDIATGREVKRLPIALRTGVADVMYQHGYNAAGTYSYTLIVDGKRLQTKTMVFAN